MQNLVTIITATYNLIDSGRKDYIVQCMNSIHNQSYSENIEHIVIDGASTDGTLDILEPYSKEGLITLISEPDTGIYNAYNKGISKAKGNYVAFMNSDDFYCRNDAIELSVKALHDSKALYAFASNYNLEENGTIKLYKPNLPRGLRSMPINHETMLFKKEYFEKYGLYNENYKVVSDFDSYLKAFLDNAPYVQRTEPIITFRSGGISSTQKELVREELAHVLYDNYKDIINCTLNDCQKIIQKEYFPKVFMRKILDSAKVNKKLSYWLYNYKYMFKSIIK